MNATGLLTVVVCTLAVIWLADLLVVKAQEYVPQSTKRSRDSEIEA